jgi:hypothetical protein
MERVTRVQNPAGAEIFSFFHSVETFSDAHPGSCHIGTGPLFREHKIDRSPPSSADFKCVNLGTEKKKWNQQITGFWEENPKENLWPK